MGGDYALALPRTRDHGGEHSTGMGTVEEDDQQLAAPLARGSTQGGPDQVQLVGAVQPSARLDPTNSEPILEIEIQAEVLRDF